jgi:uncharacterized damage-inducible protein DinB
LIYLEEADKEFYEATKELKNWDREVMIFGNSLPRYAIIELMIRHETLHHGQFIAFAYVLGINLPQSWVDAWALPISKTNLK